MNDRFKKANESFQDACRQSLVENLFGPEGLLGKGQHSYRRDYASIIERARLKLSPEESAAIEELVNFIETFNTATYDRILVISYNLPRKLRNAIYYFKYPWNQMKQRIRVQCSRQNNHNLNGFLTPCDKPGFWQDHSVDCWCNQRCNYLLRIERGLPEWCYACQQRPFFAYTVDRLVALCFLNLPSYVLLWILKLIWPFEALREVELLRLIDSVATFWKNRSAIRVGLPSCSEESGFK